MKAKTANNDLFTILSQWPSMMLIVLILSATAVTAAAVAQANLPLFWAGIMATVAFGVIGVQWVMAAIKRPLSSTPTPISDTTLTIRDGALRARLIQANQLGQHMQQIADTTTSTVLQQRFYSVVDEVNEQLWQLHQLAKELDQHRSHLLALPAWRNLPQAINQLQRQLAQAKGTASKQHLSKMMQHKQQQWQLWQQLQNQQEQVLQQLDAFTATLEIMVAQLLLVNSQPEAIYQLQQLQDNLGEEITAVADLTSAMSELYTVSAQTTLN